MLPMLPIFRATFKKCIRLRRNGSGATSPPVICQCANDLASKSNHDQFHVNHVKQAAEFEADFFEAAHLFKFEFRVQGDAAFLFTVGTSDNYMMAEFAGAENEFLQQQRTDALPMVFVMDIN